MARGHHYKPAEAHMGDRAMRARGGKAVGEDTTEGMESYTAKPNNVEDEAEGKERKHGGRAKRADGGGVAARADGGRMADEEHGETAAEEKAEESKKRARGGALKHVEGDGAKTKHRRLDRPGRKRGGGVGADMTPLSTAARTRQGTAHTADNDELSAG